MLIATKRLFCVLVHPHGRGDNGARMLGRIVNLGSPPRAWGQCAGDLHANQSSRFTPTGVGTMSITTSGRCSGTVHPHGRGDNRAKFHPKGGSGGSPPRAWGQSFSQRCINRIARFTPTGVGTIMRRLRCCLWSTVHPHGRGDNKRALRSGMIVDGSPPRAWGQLTIHRRRHRRRRFTPTGVGTICARRWRAFRRAVHPHGRGDNTGPLIRTAARNGSPPRAWGQCTRSPAYTACRRFTPTGVGTIAPAASV